MKIFVTFCCCFLLLAFTGCKIQDTWTTWWWTHILENGDALSPEMFQDTLWKTGVVLIDIRNEREMQEFGIISWTDMKKNVYDANAVKFLENLDPNWYYLLYCYHGNRSFYLKDHLIKDLWFMHVYDLSGGIAQWIKDEYPIVKEWQ